MAKNYDFNAIAGKWASAMGSASAQANYKAGIQALTVSPTVLAAAPEAMDRYVNGVQNSVTSGKRAAALQAVTLGEYQQRAMTKGAMNLGNGATASKDRYAKAMQKYPAVYSQIQAQLAGMAKGGASNAVARAAVAIQALMAAAGRS